MTKRHDWLTELRGHTPGELANRLKEQQDKLLSFRFGVALRKLKTTSDLRKTRRSIAQIQTILHEKLQAKLAVGTGTPEATPAKE